MWETKLRNVRRRRSSQDRGKKCARLVRRSTTTITVSKPAEEERERWEIKSMEMESQLSRKGCQVNGGDQLGHSYKT